MFEGVHNLDFSETSGHKTAKQFEINGLISPEGEKVVFMKNKTIHVEPKVENWLKKLIIEMKEALRYQFWRFYHEHFVQKRQYEKDKLNRVIQDYQGQILITMAQMYWTFEVGNALAFFDQNGQPNALKKVKQNFKKKVETYIELVEKPGLSKLDRMKIVALIIIDEHNREIIERLLH